MYDFIMQMRPLFGSEEKTAISEYMDEDGFITEFKKTELFEGMIAEYTGAKHCIVPNYTMVATPIKARNKLNILKLEQQLYDKN